jgi:hypothetical protein
MTDWFFATHRYITMKGKYTIWFKRIGLIGFLFFLLKGLIWLAVFLGLGRFLL